MESNLIPQERSDGPTIAFLKVPSGVLMVINFILLFISWCIMAGWKGDVSSPEISVIESQVGFFLFSTVTPWLIYILLFIMLVLQLHNNPMLERVNWPLAFVINCCIWAFMLFIASCVIASRANSNDCLRYCDKLRAAAAFGFITTIGFLFQAFFHHREVKKSSSNPI